MRLATLLNSVRELLLKLNLFKNTIVNINEGIYATRLHLSLLATSIVCLMIFGLNQHTYTITVANPTLSQFEDIYRKYAATLACPCEIPSTKYSTFMTVYPRYHQICSSVFINDDIWLRYWPIIAINDTVVDQLGISRFDFRQNGNSMFKFLQLSCNSIIDLITEQLLLFNETLLVTSQALARDEFIKVTDGILKQFDIKVRSN